MSRSGFADFRGLERLIKKAEAIAAGRIAQQAAKRVGQVALELARSGAAARTNAAGQRWKAKADRSEFTWNRGLSVVAEVQGDTIVLRVSGGPGSAFQQKGARRQFSGPIRKGEKRKNAWRLPARGVVPKKGMPRRWKDPLLGALKVSWRRLLAEVARS